MPSIPNASDIRHQTLINQEIIGKQRANQIINDTDKLIVNIVHSINNKKQKGIFVLNYPLYNIGNYSDRPFWGSKRFPLADEIFVIYLLRDRGYKVRYSFTFPGFKKRYLIIKWE